MRRIYQLTIAAALLLAAIAHTGCGSDSTTSPPTPSQERNLFQDKAAGFVYRYAGVVDDAGRGIAGKGPAGQKPWETHLYWPQDVAFGPNGNLYVLDWNNHRVLDLDKDGNFRNLIGGRFGDAPDGKADEIGLNHPTGLAFDPDGYLILSAWHNSIVKRMDLSTGMIWTICGLDLVNNRTYNGDEQPAEEASLDLPVNVIFDSEGNMYIGDQASMIVRKVDTNGVIHTVAGTPPEWLPLSEWNNVSSRCKDSDLANERFYVRYCGYKGDGGPATEAEISTDFGQAANPAGRICLDPMENLYIADTSNHCIRKVDKVTGIISTVAGVGPNSWVYDPSHEGIPATQAPLNQPRDIACDEAGNLYIADMGHHCIRKVDTNGMITTVAGVPNSASAFPGAEPKPALEAQFNQPYGIEIGPHGNLWIADRSNNLIRVLVLE